MYSCSVTPNSSALAAQEGRGQAPFVPLPRRVHSTPPLGVFKKGNRQVWQGAPFPFSPKNSSHGAPLPSRTENWQMQRTSRQQGPCPNVAPERPRPTRWPTLPLHTRFRMWVHRAVLRAQHRCFSARFRAARLEWKYRRRPCMAAVADSDSRILGSTALRGQHCWTGA